MEKIGTILKVMLCLWLIKWLFTNCQSAILVFCALGFVGIGIGWTYEKVEKHYAAIETNEWAVTSASAATTACTKSGGEPKWCACMFYHLYGSNDFVLQRSFRWAQENPDRGLHGKFLAKYVQYVDADCKKL